MISNFSVMIESKPNLDFDGPSSSFTFYLFEYLLFWCLVVLEYYQDLSHTLPSYSKVFWRDQNFLRVDSWSKNNHWSLLQFSQPDHQLYFCYSFLHTLQRVGPINYVNHRPNQWVGYQKFSNSVRSKCSAAVKRLISSFRFQFLSFSSAVYKCYQHGVFSTRSIWLNRILKWFSSFWECSSGERVLRIVLKFQVIRSARAKLLLQLHGGKKATVLAWNGRHNLILASSTFAEDFNFCTKFRLPYLSNTDG